MRRCLPTPGGVAIPRPCDGGDDIHEQCPGVPSVDEDPTPSGDPDATTAADSDADDIDPELWNHVVPCKSREASKATHIRSSLVAQLGKQRAEQLLSQTRGAVTRDSQGHNTRGLRANGMLLKLKRAEC